MKKKITISVILIAIVLSLGMIRTSSKISIADSVPTPVPVEEYTETEKRNYDKEIMYNLCLTLLNSVKYEKYTNSFSMYIEFKIDKGTIKLSSHRINNKQKKKAKKIGNKIMKRLIKEMDCSTKQELFNKTAGSLIGNTRKGYGLKASLLFMRNDYPSASCRSLNMADDIIDYI